jgi:diadenosine tetraphosphatase ApaH/serine/threonine PP2A family protein phosphatase
MALAAQPGTPLVIDAAPSDFDRLIFVGDIHGCIDELASLVKEIRPTPDDIVIAVGDFVDRGPRPDLCIEMFAERGFLAVLGNHDERLLRWSSGSKVSYAERFSETIRVAGHDPYISWLRNLPLTILMPRLNIVAVHAALDVNETRQLGAKSPARRNIFLRGRYVEPTGRRWKYLPLDARPTHPIFWADVYSGNSKVFYGHTPTDGTVRLSNGTVGLDTGVAYGRSLTAAVLHNASIHFVSTAARRTYFRQPARTTVI